MKTPISEEASPAASNSTTYDADTKPKNALRGWRFWAVFPAICVTSLLAAVESTVTSTALPFIVHQLNAGGVYVWFVNVFLLTRYVAPLIDQLSSSQISDIYSTLAPRFYRSSVRCVISSAVDG